MSPTIFSLASDVKYRTITRNVEIIAGVNEIRYGKPKWKTIKSNISIKISIRKAKKNVRRPSNARWINFPSINIKTIKENPKTRYRVAKKALAVP